MNLLEKFVDERFSTKGTPLHQLYFNFIQKTKGKNFCYSINSIVLFSLFDKSKSGNNLKNIIEKMMNCETRFIPINTLEHGLELVYKDCEKRIKKNLYVQRGPMLIHRNIAEIIKKCFNDGYDGYAISLLVYDHIDLCHFEHKDKDKGGCTGHSVIMYIDFRCNSVILFNSNEIDNLYDIQNLFNYDPEFKKIKRMISIRTGGRKMSFFSEKAICPSFNIQSVQSTINDEFGGTCLLWSMFLFEKYISRKDKDCDYAKFYINMRFPIINHNRFKTLLGFYEKNKNYFQNVKTEDIDKVIDEYNEYESDKKEYLVKNQNNIFTFISILRDYPYLREQINPQILQSLDYITQVFQLSMQKTLTLKQKQAMIEIHLLQEQLERVNDPIKKGEIIKELKTIMEKEFQENKDKLMRELIKLSEKETFVYTLILFNTRPSFIETLYSINFNYEIVGFFNELLEYVEKIKENAKIRIVLTDEEADMINDDIYYFKYTRRYLQGNNLVGSPHDLDRALSEDDQLYKGAVNSAKVWSNIFTDTKKMNEIIYTSKWFSRPIYDKDGITVIDMRYTDHAKRRLLPFKIFDEIKNKSYAAKI